MRRLLLSAVIALFPAVPQAQTAGEIIEGIVREHIEPRILLLDVAAKRMRNTAQEDCDPTSAKLRHRYGILMDSWISVSHLRFGPTEVDNRAFALAFWPDSRGATPRTLSTLIQTNDPVANTAKDYADVSIAARGLYAMEFLLYDDGLRNQADPAYFCRLIQTVAQDIAANSAAIRHDWQTDYAQRLLSPLPDGTYRSEQDVLQELFKALTTGLQFTSETRLGRPLGTYDRPRPTRAESWRSGRSLLHVALSLSALKDLALRLSADDPMLAQDLKRAFHTAETHLSALDDPVFAGVAEPQTRLKIEVLQQSVDAIRTVVTQELGPTLGVAAGFNSLDGD